MSELDEKKESNTTLRVWLAILVGVILGIMRGVMMANTFGLLSIIGLGAVLLLILAIIAIQKAINNNTRDIRDLD